MKAGRDATKRSRNIGTAKQGHGQNNQLVVPFSYHDPKMFWARVKRYRMVHIYFRGHGLPIIVEQTRKNTCHACTVEDLQHVLAQVPYAALADIEFILLRQPKRKEEILEPAWGRLVWYAEVGELKGRAIVLEAIDCSKPIRWPRSLSPERAKEFERLREDGHEIEETKREYLIRPNLGSVRATQLYRTLLHEIGQNVDDIRDPIAFDEKNTQDKEEFAHQYATKLRAKLERFGVIPFERKLSPEFLAKTGLDRNDFSVTDD